MAEKRMMASGIISSKRFKNMTLEARASYQYLMLATDAYGFVSDYFGVLEAAHTGDADTIINELRECGFIDVVDDDSCVIIDFYIANALDKRNKNHPRNYDLFYVAEDMRYYRKSSNGLQRITTENNPNRIENNIREYNPEEGSTCASEGEGNAGRGNDDALAAEALTKLKKLTGDTTLTVQDIKPLVAERRDANKIAAAIQDAFKHGATRDVILVARTILRNWRD